MYYTDKEYYKFLRFVKDACFKKIIFNKLKEDIFFKMCVSNTNTSFNNRQTNIRAFSIQIGGPFHLHIRTELVKFFPFLPLSIKAKCVEIASVGR